MKKLFSPLSGLTILSSASCEPKNSVVYIPENGCASVHVLADKEYITIDSVQTPGVSRYPSKTEQMMRGGSFYCTQGVCSTNFWWEDCNNKPVQ
jgi:hypothetical protein